jgi:hypothetical protein
MTRAGGRPKRVGPVAVGTIAAICITTVSIAPEESTEVFSSVLAVAMLAGLTWESCEEHGRTSAPWAAPDRTVKISWFMVRGLAAILVGLVGLAFRR